MISNEYDELPLDVQSEIAEDDFLLAYSIPESGNVIVWVLNDSTGQEEIEYSTAEKRFIPLDERKKRLPERQQILDDKLGIRVVQSYYFEDETRILHESFKLFSIDSGDNLTEFSRIFYDSPKPTLEEECRDFLDEYYFPEEYRQWIRNEKINYWVEKMYRFRRQVGESGCEENDAFDVTLIDNMKKIDPDISDILPDCLKKLAQIEQINAVELAEAFEKRTGYQLG